MDYLAAAADLCALVGPFSSPKPVDDFIGVVEALCVASDIQTDILGRRTKALADASAATMQYQVGTHVNARPTNSGRDFLRQFRDLKKWPTKQRLFNILERDKDEHNLRVAESAIRLAILRLAVFGDDVPPDWVERLGDKGG
jgi:hypothetical protein